MTQVLIAPRIEDPGSDVEPILTSWWYRIRPSRTVAGAQWVIDEWPELRPVSSTPALLDPLTISYELQLFRGDDLINPRIHEFRLVPDSASVLSWQLLEQVGGPGSTPPVLSELEARVAVLESSPPAGGASDVSEVAGISAFAQTFLDDTSATAVRTTIIAAAATHNHDAGDINSGVLPLSRIPSHGHAGGDITSGTVAAARLPAATDAAQGAVELATPAEALAGTDTTRAVTPQGLAGAIAAAEVASPTWAQIQDAPARIIYPHDCPGDVLLPRPIPPAGLEYVVQWRKATRPLVGGVYAQHGDTWVPVDV